MQRSLPLPIANLKPYRPVLVGVDVVMERLKVTEDTIFEMVDAGALRWVWHVGQKPTGRRVLRLWLREIETPALRDLLPVEAIAQVAGHATESVLTRRTCGHILGLRRGLVMRLVAAGHLAAPAPLDTAHVTRTSLEAFLFRRLLS